MKTHLLHKRTLILALTVLAIGITAFALTRSAGKGNSEKSAYTVVLKRTYSQAGKEPVIEWLSVRTARPDGSFVEKRTDASGKVIYLGFSHEGKFLAQHNGDSQLREVAAFDAQASGYSEAALQKDTRLRKSQPIENVQGEKCYVLRIKETAEGEYQDMYFSPRFNFPLKIVRKGVSDELTTTAVSISIGQADETLFLNLPLQLPVAGK